MSAIKMQFQNHLTFAHAIWKAHLEPGDWAIDATCGNGQDTAILAQITANVIALDIQPRAIESASSRAQAHFFCQSHESFPSFCEGKRIQLIVYNLGYLPGGDKTLTTRVESTLMSIRAAQALIGDGGLISITCYPGHPEGAREQAALLDYVKKLPPQRWDCTHHTWENRQNSPSLLLIKKKSIL